MTIVPSPSSLAALGASGSLFSQLSASVQQTARDGGGPLKAVALMGCVYLILLKETIERTERAVRQANSAAAIPSLRVISLCALVCLSALLGCAIAIAAGGAVDHLDLLALAICSLGYAVSRAGLSALARRPSEPPPPRMQIRDAHQRHFERLSAVRNADPRDSRGRMRADEEHRAALETHVHQRIEELLHPGGRWRVHPVGLRRNAPLLQPLAGPRLAQVLQPPVANRVEGPEGHRFWVKISSIEERPLEILRDLTEHVNRHGRDTRVKVLNEDGTSSGAVDAGGVSRDVVGRLFSSLFLGTERRPPALPVEALDDGSRLPKMNTEQDLNGYMKVGELMWQSLQGGAPTGEIFGEGFFRGLKLALNQRLPSEPVLPTERILAARMFCEMRGGRDPFVKVLRGLQDLDEQDRRVPAESWRDVLAGYLLVSPDNPDQREELVRKILDGSIRDDVVELLRTDPRFISFCEGRGSDQRRLAREYLCGLPADLRWSEPYSCLIKVMHPGELEAGDRETIVERWLPDLAIHMGIDSEDAGQMADLRQKTLDGRLALEISALCEGEPMFRSTVRPAVAIASSLHSGGAMEGLRAELAQLSPEELSHRIQGSLSPEVVLGKLRTAPESIEDPITLAFFQNWISRADHKKLQQLARAVCGVCSLPHDKSLFLRYVRGAEGSLPVAHTCSITLDLNVLYPRGRCTQAFFDQQMENFLEHALSGSGFTLA